MKNLIIISGFLLISINLYCQEKIIEGIVTTGRKIPLSGAEIVVKSSGKSYLSDTTGMFLLQCMPRDVLYVSAGGFQDRNVKVKEKTKYVLVNLRMKPGEENMDLALGMGHIRDREKLYAIKGVNSSQLDYSRYVNVLEALVGNFPGLQVINGEIIIRSSGSFSDNSPALIIVDGREVTATYLSEIASSDIAHISVMKDAASAIYGSRGGNGVVIVETKRGKNETKE